MTDQIAGLVRHFPGPAFSFAPANPLPRGRFARRKLTRFLRITALNLVAPGELADRDR